MRIIGLDIHRAFAEAVAWENGKLDGRQVEPAPADDLELGEVGLPELVGRRRLVRELLRGLHHDEGWAGDQIMSLEQPIDRCLRDKIALGVGKPHRQFPRRQRGLVHTRALGSREFAETCRTFNSIKIFSEN